MKFLIVREIKLKTGILLVLALLSCQQPAKCETYDLKQCNRILTGEAHALTGIKDSYQLGDVVEAQKLAVQAHDYEAQAKKYHCPGGFAGNKESSMHLLPANPAEDILKGS